MSSPKARTTKRKRREEDEKKKREYEKIPEKVSDEMYKIYQEKGSMKEALEEIQKLKTVKDKGWKNEKIRKHLLRREENEKKKKKEKQEQEKKEEGKYI